MQLIEAPAKTGYIWYRQGLWLFRKNPLAFLTLFFSYLFIMWAISLVPVIGSVLPLVFIPGIAVGFMAACRDTVANKPVFPTILFDGFRSYGPAITGRLFELGGLYIAAMACVFAIAAIADGGVLFRFMLGGITPTPAALSSNAVAHAALIVLGCYIPVAMLFWFAPVLIAWHNIGPIKAMFFSLIGCWRNRGAFIVYALLWLATEMAITFGLALLMNAIGVGSYTLAVLFPTTVIITAMLYCSFYATYRGCFSVQSEK